MKINYEITFACGKEDKQAINIFMTEVAHRYGGVSLDVKRGGYLMQNGELVLETAYTIGCIALDEGNSECYNDSYFNELAYRIAQRFNQESVLLTKTRLDSAALIMNEGFTE